jgi:nitrogen fixation/metabolism regulation signal transduction histidine kinase
MSNGATQRRSWELRLGYVRRVLLLALLAGLPAVVVVLATPWLAAWPPKWQGYAAGAAIVLWLGTILVLRNRLVRPLQTLSNVLSGLREGDYSFQARGAAENDPFGEVLREVNALVETMREHRLDALEATALVRTVMAEIDVAVFTFDDRQQLRLVNRAGERLLAQPVERLLGRSANELGLSECLAQEAPRTVQLSFPGGAGRWGIHRRSFRQGGLPHQLLVISDLSRELREEERQAWQRLVRVLGHELNNSLAPVKSIAGSLEGLVRRDPLPADWRADVQDGLAIIASRAEALSRFVGAYAQLAKLPKPRLQPVVVSELVARVASLETRWPVSVQPGPEVTIAGDPDQLEQVLINLLRNATDAVLEARTQAQQGLGAPGAAVEPGVRLTWDKGPACLEIRVEDDGPGVANTGNLFVPFFTTKPKGSGIGLVLSRQIAEGHGGSLTLENRSQTQGCIARLRLPLSTESAG